MTTDNHTNSRTNSRTENDGDQALVEDVRWFIGSVVAGLFGRLAYDQVAYREIAAAVDRGGHFAENFTDRAVRSLAHVDLMTFGDTADAQAEVDHLKQLHTAVRGTGTGSFADTRYSALNPEAWRWVAVSGLNVIYQAYVHTAGRHLDDREKELVYQTLRAGVEPLELPSKGTKLPATLAEMNEYYDSIARNKLDDNDFLQFARRSLSTLPLPTLLFPPMFRRLAEPLWRAALPIATRPVVICSAGAAHPKMRELLGPNWTPLHSLEFALYTTVAAVAWRRLPRRLTLTPLAHNRFRYEKIRARYKRLQLESFAASA